MFSELKSCHKNVYREIKLACEARRIKVKVINGPLKALEMYFLIQHLTMSNLDNFFWFEMGGTQLSHRI